MKVSYFFLLWYSQFSFFFFLGSSIFLLLFEGWVDILVVLQRLAHVGPEPRGRSSVEKLAGAELLLLYPGRRVVPQAATDQVGPLVDEPLRVVGPGELVGKDDRLDGANICQSRVGGV